MTLLLILLMMKVLLSFLLKLNSNYPCVFTSPLTPKQNNITRPLQCLKYVETLSIQMAIKPVIASNIYSEISIIQRLYRPSKYIYILS